MQVYTSATHWGVFTAWVHGGDIAAVAALASDTNPAPQLQNLPGAVRHRSRIANPAVRRGWLQHGPGPSSARGAEEFVEVSWDELIELLASELRRTVDRYGNEAIYGSSYGWASAGRFHHAQSQVHRFLNMVGGYTASRHSYSAGASEVIFPHIVGAALFEALAETTTWDVIVDHTALLVAFGGLPVKNTAVMPGGTTAHPDRDYVGRYRARGGRLVSVSPLRDDIAAIAGPLDDRCRWLAPVPGTDVAIMLGLAYVLATESLADRAFLGRYCTGYERFERYLLGLDDGIPKTPEWAAALSGLAAGDLRDLARRMAEHRTLITTSLSLQRIEHGEQTVWMAATLAAMLGQIGLPGGVSVTATAATASATRRWRAACRHCRKATIRCRRSFRWRRSVSCCSGPASGWPTTADCWSCPTSSASTGPVEIRSTTTRTCRGCVVHCLG